MTTPINVVNLSLGESSSRQQINSFNDNTAEANFAKLNYVPRIQGLLRAANWNFARKQILGTVLKSAFVNGVTSTNPPPQPFQYEYAWPSDAIKIRFLVPFVQTSPSGVPLTTGSTYSYAPPQPNTSIPFVVGTDTDNNGLPVKVIFTNLQNAYIVYTADFSNIPDMWDALFLSAATATLGAYASSSLVRNAQMMAQQINAAKQALDTARNANGVEAIDNVDRIPDWIGARMGLRNWATGGSPSGALYPTWDPLAFPDGSSY